MTLLDGELLWHLIWILPLIALIFYWGSRKRKVLLKKFLGEHADDPARVNASPVLRFWRAVLFAGTVILLLAAAARPSWGTRILPYSGQGRDLMVVFDVSKSMLSQDVRPSRLDHAKWLVRQLCTLNPGDRFGLIAFAGNAFLECPLTIDQTSFLQSVDELSVDTIPVGGTNIQQALTEAIRGFRAAETTHRAVILITDGDELTGKSTDALDRIIQLKIPLFILGIGDPSQPAIVQLRDEKGNVQTLKDAGGNVVSVPLNEKMLAGLAAKTGGIYVRSTTTHPGLDQIEARIKQLEKHDIDSGKQTRPIERPLYPLLGAFILFCLWLLLGERRNFAARTAARFLLICGLTGLSFSMSAQTVQNQPEKEEKPTPAAEKQKEEQPANLSPEDLFNLGLKAQTQEKDPAKAVQLYEQVIAAANASPEVRARAAQNLGVLNHQQARAMLQKTGQSLQAQQLDPALQQTDQALKQLAVTEEIYKNALREGSEVAPVSRNQYQLIQDRKYAEELKKKIEELKKKQQEARKNTRQAMQQQKQQNQQQNQQNQQQQNQQNQQQKQQQKQQPGQQQNQQQNQQQQGQQNQQQQQQGQQQKQQQGQQNQQHQTDKARESVRQLEQQAKDLNQKKMEDQAKKAGEELDKARQAQKQNNNKDAEKHLEKALEHLGKEQPQQDQKKQDQKQGQNKDQNQQNQDQKQQNKDQKGQPKPDKQLPKPGQGKQQNAKPGPEKEIGKEQAEALLEVMAGDEKKLKDELKARMKRNYGTRPVEKDW